MQYSRVAPFRPGILLSCAVFAIALSACSGLQLQLRNASVQKPSNVALYFSVETNGGMPVGGLTAESFRIYEDGQLISPFESKQTILNPEVAVVHYVTLLLDLSGSITESGSLDALISAAQSFAERVTKNRQIAIYGFDGGADLIPIVDFTSSPGTVQRRLSQLAGRKAKDPSTNLNGAVVASTQLLEKKMQSAKQPLRFGTLIVFTDGTDRAHRVDEATMHDALDQAGISVFAVGLGGEISVAALQSIGRTGFVRAEQATNISAAFDEVAASIESEARKFYILSYCSPARAGVHTLRVEAITDGTSGSLSEAFDATGFGANCDSTRAPRFRAGKILLRNASDK